MVCSFQPQDLAQQLWPRCVPSDSKWSYCLNELLWPIIMVSLCHQQVSISGLFSAKVSTHLLHFSFHQSVGLVTFFFCLFSQQYYTYPGSKFLKFKLFITSKTCLLLFYIDGMYQPWQSFYNSHTLYMFRKYVVFN